MFCQQQYHHVMDRLSDVLCNNFVSEVRGGLATGIAMIAFYYGRYRSSCNYMYLQFKLAMLVQFPCRWCSCVVSIINGSDFSVQTRG